jgi:Not1 N-terminal domain, CCR4-Not complex component
MENFREKEKEFKKKKYSKKSLHPSRKNKNGGNAGQSGSSSEGGSDSDDDQDHGSGSDMDDYDLEGLSEEIEELKTSDGALVADSNEQRSANEQALLQAKDFLVTYTGKIEAEFELQKNKKVKGPIVKKHKEKVAALQVKHSQVKGYCEKINDLLHSIDYVETVHVRGFLESIGNFMANPEDANANSNLEAEFPLAL